MIPQSYTTAWRRQAPWQKNYQVEQDLIIQRVLIALIKLKIEVNTREHFSVYGLQDIPVKLDSEWDNGEALASTYGLDEFW